MTGMAKKASIQKYTQAGQSTASMVNEPMALYMPASIKKIPSVAEFSYKKFQKIADKVPFTQKEWSNILHLSERTLQRYAKDNSNFSAIYIDRILHIEQLINLGLETFTSPTALYDWLKKDKPVYGHILNFESLHTYSGIQETINQIGRILHNVYT
jgi:uncharacterized protein (DUF2384 family)